MSTTDTLNLQALFGLAPEAAIAHLKSKGIHIGWNWQDTLDEAHARSFTIAKMTQMDMLASTRKAVINAMTSGGGYREFEEKAGEYLKKQGWWGKQEINGEMVQLGSPRRLSIIYHTNRRSAIMAAKYQRLSEAADTHPYWQYSAVLDGNTRPTHQAMHGAVYVHDDPFWQHAFPPNGYGCRCTVKALTEERAKESGKIVQSDLQPFDQYIGTDKSTGEIYQATRYGTADSAAQRRCTLR
ncbi:phage minor head protein [Stenoxybacter acetivorans]|uniref:phage head morphogenesis protein n=1 Tax=Stenoxybacter acetivorans TaxID=422441 RepID=UPI00068D88D9|nr:phage minor head protein [Stenoxybacter acetivorans]